MALRTTSQAGVLSATSTWGGAAPPGIGDTASVGHALTVDTDWTFGTSPNDTVTMALTHTAGGSVSVNGGKAVLVRGSIQDVNGTVHTQAAGSSFLFDNSASGGSPIYKRVNGGFTTYNLNGSSGSRCSFGAISGQSCTISGAAWGGMAATFTDFLRISGWNIASISGDVSITDCTANTCAKATLTSTSNNKNAIFRRNTFTAGTDATDDLNLAWGTTPVSGTREFSRNILPKGLTYVSKGFTFEPYNFIGGGIDVVASFYWTSFRRNFVAQNGTRGAGNGQLVTASVERNYFVVANATGNPHFVAPTALLSVDNVPSQNIFESQTPDLIDMGDAILCNSAATSGGFKIIGKNNIVLPSGYVGSTVSSGCLLTLFTASAAVLTEWYHNTANVNNSVSGVGIRGMFAFAEGNNGTAGQVGALKSNVAWGSSASQGYLGERVTGNVKDIITAANDDYNWTYNTSAGDNQRSYEDRAAANTLWTAGDAVAASVDVHQGTGNPGYVDSARNVASWCAARGYGAATYAAGLTALQADVARIEDLINYVFEGHKPTNPAMRTAGHDGACVGAANFHKTARSLNHAANLRSYLTTKYGVG